MNPTLHVLWAFIVIYLSIPASLGAQTSTTDWSVAALDEILAQVQPGQRTARIEDMEILVSNLQAWRNQLAGVPQPQEAFDGSAPTWPNGVVYYAFSNNVSAAKQKVFLDCAAEWSLFANLQFVARTTQANYVLVNEDSTIGGGESAVGMTGGAQGMAFGTNGWSHYVICHELGHALGLVHEHQRSDRDYYILVITNNVQPGYTGLIKLANTRNQTVYDFHSVMHYGAFTAPIDPTQPTMIPLPPYSKYAPVGSDDPVLSTYDRAGMAAMYGPGPALSSLVTNTQDSGLGSLRAALYFAYDHPNSVVRFNLPTNDPGYSNGVFNIQVTDELPCLENATTVDGATQPGVSPSGAPLIHLTGVLCNPASTSANGLRLRGTNCVVRGLAIDGFRANGVLIDSGARSNLIGGYTSAARNIICGNSQSGVAIVGTNAGGVMILAGCSSGNAVAGNFIGLVASGTNAFANMGSGVSIYAGAQFNTVGGSSTSGGNVISGNALDGVTLNDTNTWGNVVAGNLIGLNSGGTAALSNSFAGVEIDWGASANLIGGSSAGAGNVISGNGNSGILMRFGGVSGNVVQGNLIGLNAAGTVAVPNASPGLNIYGGAQSNLVGGYISAARNVISGNNSDGVLLAQSNTFGNLVAGNYIGLNAAGTAAIPNNGSGVEINWGASANTIGGIGAGGNCIAGNSGSGIGINQAGTTGNLVVGNLIGLNPAGLAALGNAFAGIDINSGASANVIGGSSSGAGNAISGNGNSGILIRFAGSSGNVVQGNIIGLNAAGGSSVPNAGYGLNIYGGAQSNLIGGPTGLARNVISGNAGSGVFLANSNTSGNVVAGNFIGLNGAGSAAAPNGGYGVEICYAATANTVGGPGGRNVISGNNNTGVAIHDSGTAANLVQGNTIGLNAGGTAAVPNAGSAVILSGGAQSNLIGGLTWDAPNIFASNTWYGVEMWDAATSNNAIRANSTYGNGAFSISLNSGANCSVLAPLLTSAVLATDTAVSGILNSFAGTTFQLDFYSSSAFPPQGRIYLGTTTVTTSAGGSASFTAKLAGRVPAGRSITATATDPSGNTSGMSGGVAVTVASSVNDGIPDAWRALYFGGDGTTTNSQSCATCDPQADGLSNWQKFLAGLNPTNPASVLKLNPLSSGVSRSVASFLSAPGVVYQVQYRDDLAGGFWLIAADQVVGTGTNIIVVDPSMSSTARRFFRLQVLW